MMSACSSSGEGEKARLAVDPLIARIPQEQLDRVFSSRWCDIDPEFLGFTEIYEALASIIPHHWTIVDLGCAHAPQAFFFEEHAAYIGVDVLCEIDGRFAGRNTTHHHLSIAEFIADHMSGLDLETTFAICSYVPPWRDDNRRLTREAFKNAFVYYPAGNPVFKPDFSRRTPHAI